VRWFNRELSLPVNGNSAANVCRRVDREQVELAQPVLLENQTSALAPHASGRTNVYAIGMADWSEQNVFVKELDGGLPAQRT
jgi:hypothetical protein